MKWYSLRRDSPFEEPFVSEQGELGMDEERLSECQPIFDWPTTAWVGARTKPNDGQPDDSLQNHFNIYIFSERLQNALRQARISGIQFLPVRVLHRFGDEIPGYKIANLLSCVEALDLERSAYSRFPDDYFIPERRGGLTRLKKVTVKADALQGHDVIRLKESPIHVCVSERFRNMFVASGFTGLSFHEMALS
jgi:hypothetical protein